MGGNSGAGWCFICVTYIDGKGVFRAFFKFDSGLLMTVECYKHDKRACVKCTGSVPPQDPRAKPSTDAVAQSVWAMIEMRNF